MRTVNHAPPQTPVIPKALSTLLGTAALAWSLLPTIAEAGRYKVHAANTHFRLFGDPVSPMTAHMDIRFRNQIHNGQRIAFTAKDAVRLKPGEYTTTVNEPLGYDATMARVNHSMIDAASLGDHNPFGDRTITVSMMPHVNQTRPLSHVMKLDVISQTHDAITSSAPALNTAVHPNPTIQVRIDAPQDQRVEIQAVLNGLMSSEGYGMPDALYQQAVAQGWWVQRRTATLVGRTSYGHVFQDTSMSEYLVDAGLRRASGDLVKARASSNMYVRGVLSQHGLPEGFRLLEAALADLKRDEQAQREYFLDHTISHWTDDTHRPVSMRAVAVKEAWLYDGNTHMSPEELDRAKTELFDNVSLLMSSNQYPQFAEWASEYVIAKRGDGSAPALAGNPGFMIPENAMRHTQVMHTAANSVSERASSANVLYASALSEAIADAKTAALDMIRPGLSLEEIVLRWSAGEGYLWPLAQNAVAHVERPPHLCD